MGKYEIRMEFEYSMTEDSYVDEKGTMYGIYINTENDFDYN